MKDDTIFLDIDTQFDFMAPAGALYVPGAEALLPTLERLTHFAVSSGIPILASADTHAPDDPEFQQFPPHCVRDTRGCLKIPETLLPRHVLLEQAEAIDPVQEADQFILEKDRFSFIENVNARPLLERLARKHFVVYGVATEYCVRAAVLDLLDLGGRVTVLLDAIRPVDESAGETALAEMRSRGARLSRSEDVLRELAGP